MARIIDDPEFTDVATIESATEALHDYLEVSYGQPIMSENDVKCALLMAHRALQYQVVLNSSLLERIINLEETAKKKRFFRK